MRVFNGFDEVRGIRNAVVTIGSFDGVHRGHRVIINKVIELARQENGESVVITFDPHPRKVVLSADGMVVKQLNTLEEKISLLKECGVDNLIVVSFTKQFSETPYAEFIEKQLLAKLNPKVIVVGYNHHFGHNRAGGFLYLQELSQRLDFHVYQIEEQDIEHEKVSSTIIRRLLDEGNVVKVSKYLGYAYFFHVNIISNRLSVEGEMEKLLPQGSFKVVISDCVHVWQDEVRIDGQTLSFKQIERLPENALSLRVTFFNEA